MVVKRPDKGENSKGGNREHRRKGEEKREVKNKGTEHH